MDECKQELPLKNIAFKAVVVMLSLLLQKPLQKSKSKDYLKLLEKRMELWHAIEAVELSNEAKIIQKGLRVPNTPSTVVEYQWYNEAFSRKHAKWYSSIK